MRYANRNVIVTGAAAGLGKTIAVSYAKEGADIAIIDFNDASGTIEAVKAVGRKCAYFKADIREKTQVEAAVSGAAEFFDGRIDVLINNAGFNGHYHLLQDMPLDDWLETLSINLTGTFLVTQAVLPHMIKVGKGQICSTASNVARRGLPYRGDYVCSKWALLGFNQTLALENGTSQHPR